MGDTDAFLEAVGRDDAARVREMLKEEPGLASRRGPGDASPLLAALYRGAQEALSVLVEAAPELDVHEAAALGEIGRLEALLDARPELAAAAGPDGWPPLHLAAYFGRLEAARTLLDRGAPITAVSANANANQPLHAALAGGAPRGLVEALLDAGAPVNGRAGGDYTPLHLAASRGSAELVELLLERGAEVSARAEDGSSPAEIARERGHPEVAGRLEGRRPAP